MNQLLRLLLFILIGSFFACQNNTISETLPPLTQGIAPQTLNALWAGFDPRKEPLDTEVLYEWEEDGVCMQVLRYRVGIFKGQKAMIAAIFGYPKQAHNLPGLLQIHGGGQYADYRAVLANARRGYATLSISWAGRINAPNYKVSPNEVKLFWANDTANPQYKLTTDWGLLDGYHAPCRNAEQIYGSLEPQSWTIDTIESPRNSSWFLAALAARRGLTFLEQQAQVNPNKLGVYGHSMGGKLTVLTAADPRVKAAAPSCGGISGNNGDSELFNRTIADSVYLKEIECPIIFLSPSNDFHGNLRDVPHAIQQIKTTSWRVVTSPHHSHQDHGNFEVAGLLWFDQYLKGEFVFPETPKTQLLLKTAHGTPEFMLSPDQSKTILEVEVYYTQQADFAENVNEREHRKNRFWHFAKASKHGENWIAELPLASNNKTLWAYANVRYQLDKTVSGAGYYYRLYSVDNFNLSSPIQVATPGQLKEAGVKATLKPSLLIEDFTGDWQKDWFAYKPDKWEMASHKIYNDLWKAPRNALLEFSIKTAEPNIIVVCSGSFAAEIQLNGGNKWLQIQVPASRLKNAAGKSLQDWSQAKELKFCANGSFKEKAEGETQTMEAGAEWKGERPEFGFVRWIK